jgi:hypothetical protein
MKNNSLAGSDKDLSQLTTSVYGIEFPPNQINN